MDKYDWAVLVGLFLNLLMLIAVFYSLYLTRKSLEITNESLTYIKRDFDLRYQKMSFKIDKIYSEIIGKKGRYMFIVIEFYNDSSLLNAVKYVSLKPRDDDDWFCNFFPDNYEGVRVPPGGERTVTYMQEFKHYEPLKGRDQRLTFKDIFNNKYEEINLGLEGTGFVFHGIRPVP